VVAVVVAAVVAVQALVPAEVDVTQLALVPAEVVAPVRVVLLVLLDRQSFLSVY
jgi:hypothetical protein